MRVSQAAAEEAKLWQRAIATPGGDFEAYREPVSRLWSGIKHSLRPKLVGGLAGIAELRALMEKAIEDDGEFHHRATDYSVTLGHLDRVADRNLVHVMFYETLFRQSSIDKLAAFLDVRSWLIDDTVTHKGIDGGYALPEDLARHARSKFARVYADILHRFGSAVPLEWRYR